ncbi:hypothetical protein [Streptomyces sp. SAS_270]|uniref:hypothetical protein n=1 Tax=Streptomyces sp. SAS_270 TaxID=3412748 RepID=UPI00403C1013
MTTTQWPEPLTVRAFLLGHEGPGAAETLLGPLHDGGTARTLLDGTRPLPAAADRAVEHQLASAIDSFLGLEFFDVTAIGWRKHPALKAAARRTRAAPGSEEVVALATHQVTSSHSPYVDVFLDGAKIGTLDVRLILIFRIGGLVAIVRNAHLVSIRSGHCALEARLALRRIVLAQRQGKLDLPGIWHMHDPIPLLHDEPPPPPPPPPPHQPPQPPPYAPR